MNRLKHLRLDKGLKQIELAEILNIAQSTLSGWETDKFEIDKEHLSQLCSFFNVTSDYLLGISDIRISISQNKGIKIPVLGRVQAGIPVEALEEIIDYEEITEEMASIGEYFGLRIRGTSMEPKFSDGDVVIVRKQSDVESGDIAVVLVNGSEATVKKFVKHEDGISLVPTNPAFTPRFYTQNEILSLPISIIGRVVELRAKF